MTEFDAKIEELGFTFNEIESMVFASVVPGICTDCGADRRVEPDANGYDCWECEGKGTVDSVLYTLGMV